MPGAGALGCLSLMDLQRIKVLELFFSFSGLISGCSAGIRAPGGCTSSS